MDAVKRLLWWLIAGSMGGMNRARIIHLLREQPRNAHALTQELRLDYKTVRHHLEVLEKNGLVTTLGPNYGKMYCLSSLLEQHAQVFDEIWAKVGHKEIKAETNGKGA
jgi:DNA-binding transcriptional ArsR family regulator